MLVESFFGSTRNRRLLPITEFKKGTPTKAKNREQPIMGKRTFILMRNKYSFLLKKMTQTVMLYAWLSAKWLLISYSPVSVNKQ